MIKDVAGVVALQEEPAGQVADHDVGVHNLTQMQYKLRLLKLFHDT